MDSVFMNCRVILDAYTQYTMIPNCVLIEGLYEAHALNKSRYSLMNSIPGSTGLASQVYDRNDFMLTTSEYIVSRGINAACQFDIGV